ncbi:hypothetical protein, partial [Pseudomonas helleri]|uniref:hypothetical protein n=1 Tax=Pseudomonas helleri TaxID=1608996 RepID=UPI003FD0F42D
MSGILAASCKLQAASCKLQAASCKLQAASCKLQAASCKSMGTWAGGSSDDWGFRRVYRLFVAGGC